MHNTFQRMNNFWYDPPAVDILQLEQLKHAAPLGPDQRVKFAEKNTSPVYYRLELRF